MRRRLWIALTLTAIAAFLAMAIVALSAGRAPAEAEVPLRLNLGVLVPGEQTRAFGAVTVATDAVVTEAVWDHDASGGTWNVSLCDGHACTAFPLLGGQALTAGVYDLLIEYTAPVQQVYEMGAHASATGVIRLLDATHASTGNEIAVLPGVLLLGTLVLVAGILVAPRRQEAVPA